MLATEDYTALDMTLLLSESTPEGCFSIASRSDNNFAEVDEKFEVTLSSNDSTVLFGTNKITVTILDAQSKQVK